MNFVKAKVKGKIVGEVKKEVMKDPKKIMDKMDPTKLVKGLKK
jgi:hypothetical protein